MIDADTNMIKMLKEKAVWARMEALRMHKTCREMRIASCLSDIEIFTVLYYGKIMKFDSKNPMWTGRDRFIISKPHGSVSLYPILADVGFFDRKELENIGKENSLLPGSIPDCRVPGFETINGSLGHGLGVACGIALALKAHHSDASVFVMMGDGELYEGSVWEAIMFAAQHHLDNLVLIIDNNKKCMLGFCQDIIDISPLDKKFEAFGWKTKTIDGHSVSELYHAMKDMKNEKECKPKVIIANTVKGKGVPKLEIDPLCHIKSVDIAEIDAILKEAKQ